MSYLVLARKYRPQIFEEVYAQDQITKILTNAIQMKRIAHAYLFNGPRGVGKTSLARIYAKSLNCVNGPTASPCNVCENCTEITQGISSDVIEIDGASNTGVDDIRELQKELMYSTSKSKYKIYIIDEVHMLSKNAFNALLKTLEEPPENVIFIFATTEPHKVLPTIISRCQRYDFRRIPIDAIVRRLSTICDAEKITVDDESLFTIAKKADGGMRDALSLMDQVISIGKNPINIDDVLSIFGIVHTEVFFNVAKAILSSNPVDILSILHNILNKGNDVQEFLNGMLEFVRNLLLLRVDVPVQDVPPAQQQQFKELAKQFEENTLLYIMSYLIKTKEDIKSSDHPLIIAEMSFIKLAKVSQISSVDQIIEQIKKTPAQPSEPRASYNAIPQKTPQQKNLHMNSVASKVNLATEVEQSTHKISSLTEDIWKAHLPKILDKIKKVKPIAVTFFKAAQLISVNNNFVHMKIKSQLAYKTVKQNHTMIQDILQHHFGIPVKIDFTLEIQKSQEYIKNPTIEDIKKESPKLAEFIEITDSIISR